MTFAPHPVTTEQIVEFLSGAHGEQVGNAQLLTAADHFGCSMATVKKRLKDYKAGIGKWNLTVAEKLEQTFQTMTAVKNLVPSKDSKYVPFGNFADVKRIIKSKLFYPIFITGLSGCLLYTSPSPRDMRRSRMPSSA